MATTQSISGRNNRGLAIVRAGDGDRRHGKLSTYNNHGCRCEACTKAQREYGRELRRRRESARAAAAKIYCDVCAFEIVQQFDTNGDSEYGDSVSTGLHQHSRCGNAIVDAYEAGAATAQAKA